MAARATRSASRKARATEAVATGPLGALSHDELGVVFDGLADPLQPVVAVALSSTCLGLRTPLRAALEVLQEQYTKAKTLCSKLYTPFNLSWDDPEMYSFEMLRGKEELFLNDQTIDTGDMATLGMLLARWLPMLEEFYPPCTGDADMQAMCEALGQGAAPSLIMLDIGNFQQAGAEALVAALRRGALPSLEHIGLSCDDGTPGDQCVAALVAPSRKLKSMELSGFKIGDEGLASLRKMPALETLYLRSCEIGDEGVAALVADLGKDEFKEVKFFGLRENKKITKVGSDMLVAALNAGAMPKLEMLSLGAECYETVKAALRAGPRRSLRIRGFGFVAPAGYPDSDDVLSEDDDAF